MKKVRVNGRRNAEQESKQGSSVKGGGERKEGGGE